MTPHVGHFFLLFVQRAQGLQWDVINEQINSPAPTLSSSPALHLRSQNDLAPHRGATASQLKFLILASRVFSWEPHIHLPVFYSYLPESRNALNLKQVYSPGGANSEFEFLFPY